MQIGSASDWASVVTGAAHSMAVKKDGTLWGWGDNTVGQLGDGTITRRTTPVQIGADTDWRQLAAEIFYTVAIKQDGSLWAWGENHQGFLGDGTYVTRTRPVKIGNAADWSFVTIGDWFTLAIKADGTLWGWGYNQYAQLGAENTLAKRIVPGQVISNTDWQTVSSSGEFSLAIKTDGTLWAWGYNFYGQLGDGTTSIRTIPVQIGTANDWAAVAAGSVHSLAIKKDGTLWAWGYNFDSQLGDGTTTTRTSPVQIGIGYHWSSVTTGGSYTMAIRADGTLWGWGDNYYGQLGDDSRMIKRRPVQIGSDTDWVTVSSRYGHTLGLKSNGSLWAWGNNRSGEHGNGTTTLQTRPMLVGSEHDWATVSAGAGFSMAIKTDGSLWVWGINSTGELGDGTTTNKHWPVKIGDAATCIAACAGYKLSLAIFSEAAVAKPSKPALVAGSDTGRSASDGITTDNTPEFYGTAPPNTIVSVYINDIEVATTTVNAQGDWVYALPAEKALAEGVYQIKVQASDAEGNLSAMSGVLNLTIDQQAPSVLTKNLRIGLDANGKAIIAYNAVDGGTSDLVTAAANLVFSLSRSEFACADIGSEVEITLQVLDEAGNTASGTATVTVTDETSPLIVSGQSFSIDENTASAVVVGQVAATDNCSIHQFGISAGNTNNAFAINSAGTIKVNNAEALDYEINTTFVLTITATDAHDNHASQMVTVQLNNLNDEVPVLAAIPAVTSNEETLISFTASATEPEGDVLTFDLAGDVPAGATIDAATGVFSWIPTEVQGPASYSFSVRVSDGRHSAVKEVVIVVNEVNQPPVFTSDPIRTARQGETYAYQLMAADADLPQNTLEYQALEIPSWLSFDATTQTLSGTPNGDVLENNVIRLQVSDGQATDLQEFVLQVALITGLLDNDREEKATISVYPNPTTGSIFVKVDDVGDQEQVTVSLRSLEGRLLKQDYGNLNKSLESINLHLEQAKAGVYLLQIHTKEKLRIAKIIKN